ncbi:phage minor capsid protein [Amycolatopsis sp. CB00013]|uniref:phage minor capsid protein n=1 Tax=Amycolatopsis sp. CB00013 TaxID=1703945 RepID=UPI00093AB24E|nr:phage minor capsid protein [Amycolatopsis sp. CB00013]
MPWEAPPGVDPADVVEQLAADILALYTQAEARLLGDIARRVRAGQDVPAWAAQKAAAARELRLAAGRIATQVSGQAGQAAADSVFAAWQAGAEQGLAQLAELGALSPEQLEQLAGVVPGMQAAAILAADLTSRLEALPLRVLRWQQDAYQTAVAAAAPDQLLGTGTTHSAQRATWDRLAAQGVTGFVDRAGRDWNLASYVEMAVRTATGRAWNDGHLARMASAGVELVTITRSRHACRLCTRWEGRVLALSGPAGERQAEHTLTDETVTVDVAATVVQARLEGLMHPNCRHQFVPYLPGVTKLDEIREHDAKAEQDREDLRALERKVRRNKRKAAAALTDDERQAAERRVRETQAEIREHVKRTGLNRKRYREQVNLGHGDLRAAERRRNQVAEGSAEQNRLDAIAAKQARQREAERLAEEKAAADNAVADALAAQQRTPAELSDDELAVADRVFAKRAELLGKPGQVSRTHQAVRNEIERRTAPPAEPVDLRELSDEQLADRLAEVGDDEDAVEAVIAELERREADQQYADAVADDPDAEKWAEVDRLVETGLDYEQAYAEVFDKDVEKMRREDAIARLRREGYRGRGFDELARAAYVDRLERDYFAAEAATNGFLLTPEGQRAGLDPRNLWRQNETYARRWASDELKQWWDENGRVTFDQFVAEQLGGGNGERFRTGGESWLQ